MVSRSTAFFVAVMFIIVQLIDNVFIKPTIVAKSVDLHPLVVILAVFIGGQLFGIIGMVAAIPISGVSKVIFQELSWGLKSYQLR